MSIDREGVRAPYLQLADILRTRIQTGEIPTGRKLPSQMELEQEFDLSRNTIKKALDVLKAEDLIETAPGRGLFVKNSKAE
ncbi:winged helix-turn-helix domain-containing protein [Nonomuraea roseoviolacea]|uniref:DNA-binding GntR family transcriptional regulator n=1 Tax=Nonomuraea roseoviolacea subsp. carminata TaxID=160689 RepID=A0ABT1JTU8_9ACTN|nr:winged helix-turn-helix domain-containing protein [Nonomuraea roseoviolacea]MCP2345140.1 DNA-binding GntR family transcriptional regulator [Nonomuraea roseoviolacea subsp. carminata]